MAHLTPVDMLHVEFKRSLKGYNCQQVDSYIASARESLEESLRDRAELQKKLEAAEAEAERLHKIEKTMTEALTLAQKTAEEVKTNAHRQAEMIISEAEQSRVRMTIEAQQEAEKYRADIAILRDAKCRFEAEFRALLRSNLEWLGKRGEEESRDEVA